MARKPRFESPTSVYHFITRGVNKKKIYHRDGDYAYYLKLLKEYRDRFGIEIYHYCIMSNHAHLILKADTLEVLSRFGHFTQRRYAYYYCKTYRWSEQVFRRSFLSIPITDDTYLLECGRYVERNPLEAGLVKDPLDHAYSSYSHYALGKKDDLLTESPLYPTLGHSPAERMTAYRFYVCCQRIPENDKLTIPF